MNNLNTRLFSKTTLRTCTALALPVAIMLGCAEGEQNTLGRAQTINLSTFDASAVLNTSADGMVKVVASSEADETAQVSPQALSVAGLINLPQTRLLFFVTDKDQPADADLSTLKQHAEFLIHHPQYLVQVNGHADERGTLEYNADLSTRRAQQVALALTSYGVPQAQIKVASFGEEIPLHNTHRWDENRRIEMQYIEAYGASAW